MKYKELKENLEEFFKKEQLAYQIKVRDKYIEIHNKKEKPILRIHLKEEYVIYTNYEEFKEITLNQREKLFEKVMPFLKTPIKERGLWELLNKTVVDKAISGAFILVLIIGFIIILLMLGFINTITLPIKQFFI